MISNEYKYGDYLTLVEQVNDYICAFDRSAEAFPSNREDVAKQFLFAIKFLLTEELK